MDSPTLASWIGASAGIIAIIISIVNIWSSRKIRIKGTISSPVIWMKKDGFPCQVELINHGTRQAFISRVSIGIFARNSWEICVDLKLHKIDSLLLIDGEKFERVLLLQMEMDELKKNYTEDSCFLDRLFPMRVVFGFETAKKQFIKIPIEKKLKIKIVKFVKNQTNKNLKRGC